MTNVTIKFYTEKVNRYLANEYEFITEIISKAKEEKEKLILLRVPESRLEKVYDCLDNSKRVILSLNENDNECEKWFKLVEITSKSVDMTNCRGILQLEEILGM
ncbi:hypothetical protein [Bacillus pumilus]|uniref:hypothetical protein n=1 Tax=Bacillus pumilus TaxID=1408 RepID=UPI001C21D279|nr:hypothetical protein [Bacillus pumilus]MBU8573668.1 hypothetical protein [Bacillus pumilus]